MFFTLPQYQYASQGIDPYFRRIGSDLPDDIIPHLIFNAGNAVQEAQIPQ
jgi:hypothetical protein